MKVLGIKRIALAFELLGEDPRAGRLVCVNGALFQIIQAEEESKAQYSEPEETYRKSLRHADPFVLVTYSLAAILLCH